MRNTGSTHETSTPPDAIADAEQGGATAPRYVTEEQLNSTLSARFATLEKKLSKAHEGLASTLSTKLEEMVGDVGRGGVTDAQNKAMSPEERRLKEAGKRLEEERAAIQRQQDKVLRQRLEESLRAGGITGNALRIALGVLVDGEKRVQLDEDGEEVLFHDSEHGHLPLAEGVKRWLKSEDGKIYLRGSENDKPKNARPEPPMTAGRALLGMHTRSSLTGKETTAGEALLGMVGTQLGIHGAPLKGSRR